MTTATTQVDDLRLVAAPTAVNCAEMFVRFALLEWRLRPLADDGAAVIRHLVRSSVEGADKRSPRFLTVRLRLHRDVVVVELDDDRPGEPPELPGWTINTVALPGGHRTAWCELPLPAGLTGALPTRAPHRMPSPATEYPPEEPLPEPDFLDSQILQRVLHGLNGSSR